MRTGSSFFTFFKIPLIALVIFSLRPCSVFAQTRTIDSLLTVLGTTKHDTSKALICNALCRAYMMELNDMDNVQLYAVKAFALSEPIHFKKGLGYAIFYLGLSQWTKGNFDMALNSFKKATILLKETVGQKAEGACYINIGQIYTELGKYPEALEYIKKGTNINEALNDKLGLQSGYLSIGNIYAIQGNYTQATNYFLKSLKLSEQRNDQIFCSIANNNIGDVFYAQNKFDMALFYYKKAVKHLEDIKDERVAGSIYTGMGNVYWKKKQYKEALIYHLKDLNSKENYGDKQGVAVACNKIGFDYFGQEKFEKALSYQLKSYNLCKQISYKKGLIDACGGVGNVYEKREEFPKSLTYYSEMLAIAKDLDYKEGVRDAYLNHASVFKKLNQFEKALQFTKLFNETKDTLLNKDNFKQVAELNTRYETDKKEKEILLLTKDQQLNTKIIKQQQLVRWGLIGGLGLLSISIFSIYRRYRFKQKANELLKKQKQEIQQKNLLITDSIDYAQTIQEAVLPSAKKINLLLSDYFILYKPKETVSGDFYWSSNIQGNLVCAVADCSGHGVPGAFMSLLGYNMLENVVKRTGSTSPATVLQELNKEMFKRLPRNAPEKKAMRGMNISLISIHKSANLLECASASMSIYIVRDHTLIEFMGNRLPLGENPEKQCSFLNQQIHLKKGDMIYLFTDGFSDQKGGLTQERFTSASFKELLISISSLSPEEQKIKLHEVHRQWMGEKMDQTDDILILGLRF